MDRVRIAVVGCGIISQMNVPGYLQHPNCEVYALCDAVRSKPERRVKEWGIAPKIYTDYSDVLNDPNVDAVELLTPTHLHAKQTVAALDAGKHVSCQKPMCTTIAEADEIIAAVKRSKTKFRLTENYIYYPPLVKAEELLNAGAIGEPSLLRFSTVRGGQVENPGLTRDPEAYIWRRDPNLNPGGQVYDDGVHHYAMALKWVGDIEKVQAMLSRTEDFMMETPSAVIWKFMDRNCLGIYDLTHAPQMTIAGRYFPVDQLFEIHGSSGIIFVTRCTGEMLDLPPVMLVKGTETVSFDPVADLDGELQRSC